MSDWISVDERLPFDDSYVLVLMANGAVFSDNVMHCCKYSERYGFDRSRVTHWMPLPQPPES